MKTILYSILTSSLITILFSACEADNMEAPYCHIQGKMCYQGKNIGVRGSGTSQLTPSVQIELW